MRLRRPIDVIPETALDIRIVSPAETGRGWRVYLNEYFIECATQADAQHTYERALAATRQVHNTGHQYDASVPKPAGSQEAMQRPDSLRRLKTG
jgi:hypothetical protein